MTNSDSKTSWITLGLGLVLGVVIGLVILRLLPSTNSNSDSIASLPPQSVTETSDNVQVEIPADSAEHDNKIADISSLETLLSASNRSEQVLALSKSINSLDVSKLVELLEDSNQISSKYLRQLVQETLVQKLASVHPQQTIELIDQLTYTPKASLINWIFQEWSRQNFDEAVFATQALGESDKTTALTAILNSRQDLSDAIHLKAAKKFGYEHLAVDRILSLVQPANWTDPAEAWKQITQLLKESEVAELSEIQQEVIAELAVVWFEQQGEDVIKNISDQMEKYPNYTEAMSRILAKIGRDNPGQALQFAADLNLHNRSLLSTIMESASTADPVAALKAAFTVASHSIRDHLERVVISAWIELDAEAVLDNLLLLPETVRTWGQQEALVALISKSPEFVASYLSTVENDSVRTTVAPRLATAWTKVDPLAALDWAKTNPKVYVNPVVAIDLPERVIRRIAADDFELAMQLALEHPLADGEVGLEAIVIGEMMSHNVEDAIAELNQTRNEATKMAALGEIGREMVTKGRSDDAIKLAKDISSDAQIQYFESLSNSWAYHEPTDAILKIDNLPDGTIRENLATHLASYKDMIHSYTPEQIEQLKKYVHPVLHGMLE